MPAMNGQPDRFISSPKAYDANTAYAASTAISARPVTRRGSSPAPMPTQAEQSIWYGSHGPTPAVISAEAKSDVQPSTNPKPGPKTRPPRISRKNVSSTPATPGEMPRRIALAALSTPRTASTRGSRPPSLSSASTTAITIGSSPRKRNGGSTRSPVPARRSSGQQSIISPANDATASTSAERGEMRTAAVFTALATTSSTRSHGAPSTLVTCGANAGDSATTRRTGPDETTSPSASTTTSSATCATNSTSWVATSTARPSAARPRRMPASTCLAA